MDRKLYRGDFRPTLEDALAAELRAAKATDPLACVSVLVPSNLLKLHLRRMLAERLGAHVNVRLVTLHDVATALNEAANAAAGLRRLPSSAAELIAAELARAIPQSSSFGTVAMLPRFAGVLAATLRDLRDAQFTPEDLEHVDAANLRDDERAKIADVARLLRAFEQRLAAERAIDDAALLRLAVAHVPRHSLFEAHTKWCIYGFYDFTAAQRALIDAIVERVDAAVFLPMRDESPFTFAQPAQRSFEARGFVAHAQAPRATTRAIDLVRARLFDGDAATAAAHDDSLRLVSCASAAHEAREVVRIVRNLARDGVPLHRVGVLARDAADVARIDEALRSALDRSELAAAERPRVYAHGGRPASEQRAIVSALLLQDVLDGKLARRTVFEWLHHGGLPHVRAWEDVARVAGIVGGSGDEEWRQRLSHARRRIEHQIEVADAHPIDDEAEDRARLERRKDAVLTLDAFIERFAILARTLEAATTFAAKVDAFCGLAAEAGADGATLAVVRDALDGLRELDTFSIAVTRESFALASRASLDGETVREGTFECGLFLGTVAAARGLSFDTVILCGLIQGQFPRRGTQDPILLDDERMALSKARVDAGAIGLPLASRAVSEDRMLLRLVFGAAERQLVATWSRFDTAKNREVLPSTFVFAVAEVLAGQAVDLAQLHASPFCTRVSGSPTQFDPEPIDLREFDRAAIASAVVRNDPAAVLFLKDLHGPLAGAWIGEIARWRTPAFTPHDGVFDAARAGLLPPAVVSASALESFAVCPFQYFAKHALHLDEPDEPEESLTLDARDRGTLVHGILRETVEQLVRAGLWPPSRAKSTAVSATLQRIAKKHFDRFEVAHSTGLRLVWEIERARWLETLDRFLASGVADGGTGVPTLLEAPFGFDSNVARLRLAIGGLTLEVEGKIDRVDVDTTAHTAAVFDYKTGKAGGMWSYVDGGRKLQLPLYAKAVEQVLQPGTQVVRAAYLHCPTSADPEELAAFRTWSGPDEAELTRVLEGIIAGITRGVFFANPSDPDDVCARCDVRLVCGFGAGLEERFEKKRADAAAKIYFDLDAQQPTPAGGT